ncbi:hypothetical protein GW915_01265 [bacterium]|nr:hypothetical protein [bacterium]
MRSFQKVAVCILMLSFYSCSSTEKRRVMIKTEFTLNSQPKIISNESSLLLGEDQKTWVTLLRLKEDVSVLARIVDSTKDTIHLEYILLDATRKPESIVSTPTIIAKFNEKSEISVKGTSGYKLSLLARTISYKGK